MDIQINELSDGRSIGFGVFEIASFPPLEGSTKEIESELEQAYNTFLHAAEEFYKLGQDSNTVAELMWAADKAEKQTFRSRIRIFCSIRKISTGNSSLKVEIEGLLNHFSLAFSSKQFHIETGETVFAEFTRIIGNIHKECLFSVVKKEKIAGNAASIYPYYYTDVIPENNMDNFASIIAALSQYQNCCIVFQLFPAQFTQQEKIYLNEVTGELGRLISGMITQQGMYRDKAAEEPYAVLSSYRERAASPLFLYNILVFGEKADCTNLAGKVISLLQSGRKKVVNSDFTCLDLTGEKVDLPAQYLHYPWNINNKLVYTYRNKQLLERVPMAKILYRLPYIITADEAAAFFRLPFREKTMAALRSNQTGGSVEHFDASVVSENNIVFGALVSHDSSNIHIGCPENAFTKHALIVGTPGSGKTTFSFNILLQFAKRGIPFLAIEPTKSEYRALIDALPDIQIFTPGNNKVSPFIVNPFIPPKGITIEQYIPSLAGAFKAAFAMPSPLDIIFLRAIRACYSENGWKDYSKQGDTDVMAFGLYEFILTFKKIIAESDYSGEVKGNLQSAGVFRLMNLIEQNSNIFDTIHTVPIEDMLLKPTILELNSIDNTEQKALIMALLLISIGVYTKNNQAGDGKLKNIILIDEAHVLLGGGSSANQDGADSQGATIKSLQDMIAEIRSYGTGIIIADQSPTKVSREVIANTDIKISFRLVQASEKELIADSTNMDKNASQHISRLKPGEAYVYFSRLENPQLILTEDIREKEGIRLSVPNEEITNRMTYWKNRKSSLKPFAECNFCEVCKNGCDISLRAKADYYANRFLLTNQDKIKDKKSLEIYMLGVDKFLSKVTEGAEANQKIRMVQCTAIRFMRKVQLGTPVRIQRNEVKQILSCPKSSSIGGQNV
ncbi:hypothetical protein AGMMS49546_14030 [Spirochaetia bacterium]|nr:hypothetical protein AGMMS49546_14030 [Spirochaetia bacterium]